MGKLINQFMWGYQSHFRIEFELRAERVLQKIGCLLKPQALLIGIRTPDNNDGYKVCVEPEDGIWTPDIFSKCESRANEINRDHPDQNIFYGDAPSMNDKPENILKKSVRESILETVRKYDEEQNTVSFCGWSTRVAGYYVVPILQFDKHEFESFPRLPEPITWESLKPISGGLHHSLINRLLEEACSFLEKKDPGRFLLDLLQIDPTSLIRSAGREYTQAVALCLQDFALIDTYDNLDIISSLGYERSDAKGTIIFTPINLQSCDIKIRLRNPIPMSEHKLVRKLIEMSNDQFVCLYEREAGIIGMGDKNNIQCNHFAISFNGRYKWSLYYNEKQLMKCEYGIPHMPVPRIKKERFEELATRLFPEIDINSIDQLWEMINAAKRQKHGTMIVITTAAEKEAKRLDKQCLPLEPRSLNSNSVLMLSKIDGAILLDTQGMCHAIGVILDGRTSEKSDMSRGARYNSAIRYIDSLDENVLCIVISEDGYIDILPDLRSQILRSDIKKYIKNLKNLKPDNYHETRNWLDNHRFYFTEDECNIINTEISRIENSPTEGTEIRIRTKLFTPDPEMNSSYYFPENNS